jgi:hypothetical protein
MYDTIEIGPVPCDENCEQVGTDNYSAVKARKECEIYKAQIERTFTIPEGVFLKITSNPHDFGNYFEVVIKYDESNEKAVEAAYHIEEQLPAEWDEVSKQQLKGI